MNSSHFDLHLNDFPGHLEACKLLIASGANVNDDQTRHKDTPLHAASNGGN